MFITIIGIFVEAYNIVKEHCPRSMYAVCTDKAMSLFRVKKAEKWPLVVVSQLHGRGQKQVISAFW